MLKLGTSREKGETVELDLDTMIVADYSACLLQEGHLYHSGRQSGVCPLLKDFGASIVTNLMLYKTLVSSNLPDSLCSKEAIDSWGENDQ